MRAYGLITHNAKALWNPGITKKRSAQPAQWETIVCSARRRVMLFPIHSHTELHHSELNGSAEDSNQATSGREIPSAGTSDEEANAHSNCFRQRCCSFGRWIP